MIRNNTARRLMYDWHGGQASALYSAASSGLLANSWASLVREIEQNVTGDDKTKLLEWVHFHRTRCKDVYLGGRWHAALPWAPPLATCGGRACAS